MSKLSDEQLREEKRARLCPRAVATEILVLRARTSMSMGVGEGSGQLFVYGDYDSIKAAQAGVFERERFAKALREIVRGKQSLADAELVQHFQAIARNALSVQP